VYHAFSVHIGSLKSLETNNFKDVAAKCAIKERFTTKFERCEDSKAWDSSKGGRNVRADDTKTTTRSTKVRADDAINVHNTGSSSRDSEFDNSPMYSHQQEAVSMFEAKDFGGLGMQMGTGKSRAVLEIAARKWQRKEIDSLIA